ncbi:ATP phosphoribosyltransferase [candidate division FCPU426 bacterium]|nr:ATP phosphoribosyltransferase [candidate division FCPU426 bacterium]
MYGGAKVILKLALPAGSLKEATFTLMKKAGYVIANTSRSYYPRIDDPEIELMLVRAQEIPRYVESGAVDAGLTGADWTAENNAKVHKVAELVYAKQGLGPVRWVLAVPENSTIRSIKDLQGKRIATELVSVVKEYLDKKGVRAKVEFSWGATEAKPPHLADAIVELTETGRSLQANNLRIVETIFLSTTVLISNLKAWKDAGKRRKIESLDLLLQGALLAETKVGLKMNVQRKDLRKILALLPALKKPTIAPLTDPKWLDVETIIQENVVRDIIPRLKMAGAQGIIEYPLNKVVL